MKGNATGGSICVELANITVCYVMEKILYSDPEMMRNGASFKRFVGDCVWAFTGSVRLFIPVFEFSTCVRNAMILKSSCGKIEA